MRLVMAQLDFLVGDIQGNAGRVITAYHKQQLPNYSVFDEKRNFTPGDSPCIVNLEGIPVWITICEDIWSTSPAMQASRAGKLPKWSQGWCAW